MIRKPYFVGNRALDDLKNFSRSEKLAFCSLTIKISFIIYFMNLRISWLKKMTLLNYIVKIAIKKVYLLLFFIRLSFYNIMIMFQIRKLFAASDEISPGSMF
ncbi:hypothetical protein BBF96_11685 [Anoxybacter fermentans]|uniref:Uncharacterized protein n=1 Tax=Anoxybacter fermentans TaxID=1323375 RepID=A0A3Q9HRJ4_9FIRM|nr:hypothetical protein BBF96_11685 [Anoxybacter fermentans]